MPNDDVEEALHEMIDGRDTDIVALRKVMRAVRDDLILRGDLENGRSADGRVIVSVSQTIWNEFCAAIGDQATPAPTNT